MFAVYKSSDSSALMGILVETEMKIESTKKRDSVAAGAMLLRWLRHKVYVKPATKPLKVHVFVFFWNPHLFHLGPNLLPLF